MRGVLALAPRAGTRVVCYCDDCQAYARFLGRDDILDRRGGTDIWQTRPALVRITQGEEELACLRLSERGMIRWYARCCRTPIANTMTSARAPFAGIVHRFVADPERAPSMDAVLGPPTEHFHGRFAIGGAPEGVHPTVSAGSIVRIVGSLMRGLLARGHAPSPFFDPRTKRPRALPEVLSKEERERSSPAP